MLRRSVHVAAILEVVRHQGAGRRVVDEVESSGHPCAREIPGLCHPEGPNGSPMAVVEVSVPSWSSTVVFFREVNDKKLMPYLPLLFLSIS